VRLRDEGYEVHLAATLPHAMAALDEQGFHLVLSDLFASEPGDVLTSAQALRERAGATPVGVMTGWRVDAEQVERAGFAFLVAKPFDVEQLVAAVAIGIHRALTPEQERQAEVVRRYFAALTDRDWDALAALCAEDVTYYLPAGVPYAGEVRGRQAFRDYSEQTFRNFPDARFEYVVVSALPNGLAARYSGTWHTATGEEARLSGAVVFRFAGERIARIGVQLPEARFRALLGEQAR
jgi:ketosteroid isomerase-like protein/CheY-like chemotaxis protein